MTGERVVRRLAAILAADVAGYSRLMGRDEQGTLTRLKAHRTDRLEPTLARHGGRLVKLTGDGALVEFPSAVDALGAAIEFQQAMAEANSAQSDDTAIVFRIGLHLGDLIVDGDDLYGDGVNVAARLEAEAPAGGIVISGTMHEAVAGRLKATFEDLGRLVLKNIERPVQAFAMKWDAVDWKAPTSVPPITVSASAGDLPLALPDKPSIAVLPFQNMSGDPEQEYFADGMVEDIITALSRFKSLFVIARNSSFTYKGKAVDIKQVGRELGVRYVLEGSVRKAGGKVRITCQLIEADTGMHIWADRIDGILDDVFELQDQVTSSVIGAISQTVEQAEIERSRRKPTGDLQAYDYYLRGMSRYYAMSKDANDEAIDFLQKAVSLDPEFALAYSQAATCYTQRKGLGWDTHRSHDIAEAERLVRCALALDREDPRVLANTGYALAFVCERLEEGAALLDQSVALNPNFAVGWIWRANAKVLLGERNTVVEDYERALRLNPVDPRTFLAESGLARALFLFGRYDEAATWAAKVLRQRPTQLVPLLVSAASHALAGRIEEAGKAFQDYRLLDPSARISNIRERMPFRRDDDVEIFARGLRLAGMPE